MLKRLMKIGALALVMAIALTGCMDYSQIAQSMVAEDDEEPQATLAPLDKPMYTDRDALYALYNQAEVSVDTLDGLTERLGEPEQEQTENGVNYIWKTEDNCGFVGVFFDSGRLRAKALYYEDLRQLGQLSAATSIDQFASLNNNYTYEMVCGMLGGRSMEIMQIAQDSSLDPEIKRVFVWCDEKGNVVQILFKGDERLESVTYSLAE